MNRIFSICLKTICCTSLVLTIYNSAFSQEADSLLTQKQLPEVTVIGTNSTKDVHLLPQVVGTSIYATKKATLIVLDNVNGNVVTNTMRQVMAKVPGIHVWESDGSGIQIGVSARGLSPNRSWEFNIRQNGYDIAADPYGYPEAYYNPPLQAVQRIEVIRGQGSLQYGPQFGGMVNYLLKNGNDINQPFQFQTQQTIGSNNMINTFNAVGGKTAKWHYYAFLDHRHADGWRNNSRYFTNAAFGTVTNQVTNKLSITAEVLVSHIRSQQPGGLTDAQFAENSQQSNRGRNWMDIEWKTFAIIGNYNFNEKTRLNVKLFGMLGDRTSIGFTNALDVKDSINTATSAYNKRTLDIDRYRNYGTEIRFLTNYAIGKKQQTFSAGVRYFKGNTFRYRDGKSTTGSDYDATLTSATWPKDIQYQSTNYAIFAENLFALTDKLLVVPGIRYEYIDAAVKGRNGFDATNTPIMLEPQQRGRGFVIGGIGVQYNASKKLNIYANITQAFRPIQFSDLNAPPTTDVIDPNLSDAKGFNADLGFRGAITPSVTTDISVYYLQYNNRIGSITQQRLDGSFYNLRTNVGNSNSNGIEALVEWNMLKSLLCSKTSYHKLNTFISYAYNIAQYGNLKVVTKQGNNLVSSDLADKKVENAPEHILRSGITYGYKNLSITTQISHVSSSFSDANNTVTPSANGQIGLIPAYTITDLTLSYKYASKFIFKLGCNNVTNQAYFTRRAGGYPGPGLLPSDGRTFFLSFGAKI